MTSTAPPEAATPSGPPPDAVTWERPGPGTWELDTSHNGPAPGPVLRNLYEEGLRDGMAEGFALFGSPLKGMEMRWVNGRFYRRLVPLLADRDLPRPPPTAALWLATRIHPAFRRQERTSRATFATKAWRTELDRWEHEWKPDLLRTNRAFTEVEVTCLTDGDLAHHLAAVHEHLRASTRLHFRLHATDMGPLGDLLVHLADWGLPADAAFGALVHASPATREPARRAAEIAAALATAGTDPASLGDLADVGVASPRAGRLLDAYLRDHGWRLTTGYDLEDRCLIELPHVILSSISAAAGTPAPVPEDPGDRADGASDAALAELRAQVPAEEVDAFDELVADARSSYGLRDENGPLTYEWPAGLLRRALLDAGRRLTSTGHLSSPDRIFELDAAEVVALLEGRRGPSPAEVEERAAHRRWEASLVPPPRLGPEPPPPPLAALTPGLRRTTRVVLAVVEALEASGEQPLAGTGIGTTAYVGTARVVTDPTEALGRLEPGDVVVAPYTAPTYNAVLSIAGAVVTQEGGLLCHAAVIARELGLPAVVGATGAMQAIPDGATVEVDPVAGRVRVVATPAGSAAPAS